MDSHYTPTCVANCLVQATNLLQPKRIADLAAGNGDLLFAAEQKWPNAQFVATDIDSAAIRRLALLRPSWSIGRCDLRNRRSRSTCAALKSFANSADLLLLNPPFSCRGGTRFLVKTPTGPIHASTAMSFLLHATDYVADTGHIACVLPLGCLHNQKDTLAWDYLRSQYIVDRLQTLPMRTFPRSTAKTTLVHLAPKTTREHQAAPALSRHDPNEHYQVTLIRGTCPIHRGIQEQGKPVIVHYTDIFDSTVNLNGRHGFGTYRCVTGPAVVIPRVGNITIDKIAILTRPSEVMLSDCVIALKPTSDQYVVHLKDTLTRHFTHIQEHYTGTGAPFITISRLTDALQSIGVQIAT